MKKCTKCGKEKMLTEFVKHKRYADGHYSQCKTCTYELNKIWSEQNKDKKNEFRKAYRERNREAIRVMDQEYYMKNAEYLREKTRERMQKYLLGKGKETRKFYKKQNPEKLEARKIMASAVRSGKLKKTDMCQICNQKSNRIEGHHADYSKPLEVLWLCCSCHRYIHRKIIAHRERLTETASKEDVIVRPQTEILGGIQK